MSDIVEMNTIEEIKTSSSENNQTDEMELEEHKDRNSTSVIGDINNQLSTRINNEEDNVTLVTSTEGQVQVPPHQNNEQFLGMLNLLPRKRNHDLVEGEREEEESETHKKRERIESSINEGSNITPPPRDPTPPNDPTTPTLTQIFKKDSQTVLTLLSKALSMESLSDLLKKEQQSNSAQLKALKEKLEKAHSILSQCCEQKRSLMNQIEKVTEEIHIKRKQLASTREDLRVLSMEESQLKIKRDGAYEKCSELRKKVSACQEAIQQIHNLYGKKKKGEKGQSSSKLRQAES